MDWRTGSPELWEFLESLRRGAALSGTVAAIERFGVFVALNDGPSHPTLPGVGFITIPELTWRRFDAPTDVVTVGQRITCRFLGLDTHNAEARLSLKALEPDPFLVFASTTAVGQELRGTVDTVLHFGILVHVADGVVGLVPFGEVDGRPAGGAPEELGAGEEITVVVTAIEQPRRRVFLSGPPTSRRAGT